VTDRSVFGMVPTFEDSLAFIGATRTALPASAAAD
jgi:hypothetical protein